ncbi:hypothetical protein D3C81_2215210 [compost metagenome]
MPGIYVSMKVLVKFFEESTTLSLHRESLTCSFIYSDISGRYLAVNNYWRMYGA